MTVKYFYVATKLNSPDQNEFTSNLSIFVKLAWRKILIFFYYYYSRCKGLKILKIWIKFYRNKNVLARGLGLNLLSVLFLLDLHLFSTLLKSKHKLLQIYIHTCFQRFYRRMTFIIFSAFIKVFGRWFRNTVISHFVCKALSIKCTMKL